MSRQLNDNIFNDNFLPATSTGAFEPLPSLQTRDLTPLYDELIKKVERSRFEVQEWVKSLNLRFEKAVQRVQALEERLTHSLSENHERMGYLANQVKQRTNSDTKFEALIERHNQIVQSFELRLSQALKVIDNQSLQLAKQQELIGDARRQIEKLKRL